MTKSIRKMKKILDLMMILCCIAASFRYFQPDGNGILKMEDGTVLKPNDRYLLGEKKFRLYYTSKSTNEAQTIDLYFENNWLDVRQLSFSFNNKKMEKEISDVFVTLD